MTETATPAPIVDEPGVYDLTDAEYHADPVPGRSLSSSGARKLLPPSCPALFHHEQLHGRSHKAAFDFGHAAHLKVLGAGPELVVIDADDWRTKAAREDRDAARAEGKVPLLRGDAQRVDDLAAAVRAHPIASALFCPDRGGRPEVSLFWPDTDTGIWRRGRLDWLPAPTPSGRVIVADLKTTPCAAPAAVMKSVANYGYHQQDQWYRDGIRALDIAEDPGFVFVFIEQEPPYLITVVELDDQALRIGAELNRRAINLYAHCREHDAWPGYAADVQLIGLPRWATYQHEETDL